MLEAKKGAGGKGSQCRQANNMIPAAMAKIVNANESPSDETICTVHVFCAQSNTASLKLHQHSQIIDSGASCTMCSNQNWFQQYSTLAKEIPVILGNNSTI
jgi:hypothetical protein